MKFVNIWKICITLSESLLKNIQHQTWIKGLFKFQDRSMDFKVTEYDKFTDTVSDSPS